MIIQRQALVLISILISLMFLEDTEAGLAAYGIGQTGCNSLWVVCVAAAGGTAGATTGGAAVPAAILACNVGQGTCMAACVAAGFAPIP